MYYKIASLVLSGGQKNNSIADIFISQPDAAKEALVGKLFVLAEIESQKTEAAKLLDFLINNINFNYYQNEKVILKERIETISIEGIFESALAKTNKDLLEFLSREKIKISPYAINLTVCVLHENELYISTVGKNKNLLIYKEKAAAKTTKARSEEKEKSEYKLVDVIQVGEAGNEGLVINKLFSEVVAGKIPQGGYFLVINEALSEYLSPKQMIEIVTRLSPSGAAEQIRNLLEKINSLVSFLGIIVKNTSGASLSGEEIKRQIENQIKNWDYKPEVVSTEERTEAIMTPAGAINIKRWIKSWFDALKNKKQFPKASATPLGKKAGRIFLLKDKIFVKKRVSALSPKNIASFLSRLSSTFARIFSAMISKTKKSSEAQGAAGNTENEGRPVISKRKATAFLLIAILLIVALTTKISLDQKRQEKDRQSAAFASLIEEIDKNQNRIDSFLIYGNENEARQLWQKNQEMLAGIAEEDAKERAEIESLREKQATQLEKLRKVIVISDLKKIADFSNLNKEASPNNLVLHENKLYAASPKEKAVYKVDLKEGLVTVSCNLGDINEMEHPSASTDGILYIDGSSALLSNGKSDLKKIEIDNAPVEIGGAGMYNGRLYLIDKKNGQIMRYSRNEDKFSSPTEWLESKIDLSTATDLFIDGNIYILNRNGKVEKYLKGSKESLSLAEIDESISDAKRLQVEEKGLYISEPSKKRLAVFDDKGTFTGQYIFTGLDDISDISVSEKDGQVYILSGQAIYQASLK